MTIERWNPKTALRRAVPFFQALPHVSQITLTTCGGESLLIYFDPGTSELVAETDDEVEIGRVYIEMES
jgi:hypothetical protein